MSANDTKLELLLSQVEAKLKALEEKKKSLGRRTTDGMIFFEGYEYNIFAVNDVVKLVAIHAKLVSDEVAFDSSAAALGVNAEFRPITAKGDLSKYALEDYLSDINIAVTSLQIQQSKKDLQEAEKKLTALLSNDAKTTKEVNALEKLLGKL